jgi:hypothetical protein
LGASASDTATTIDIGKGEIGALPAEFELLPRSEIKQGSWTVVRDDDFRAQRVNGQSGFRRETVDRSCPKVGSGEENRTQPHSLESSC